MKNKKAVTAIGLAVGITMLASAAFAGYSTMSGYEVGKTACKALTENENYTSEVVFSMSVDGEEIMNESVIELYDRDGEVSLNIMETDYDCFNSETYFQEYVQDNMSIQVYNNEDTYIYPISRVYGAFDQLNGADAEDKKTYDKVIRFAELACDTFMGDLKNNFVYVSGDNDSATYEINLDAVQIPELVNAGLSAMFSSMSEYDDLPYMVLGTDPVVKSASLVFTVDNEGRATDAAGNITMSGEGHEAAVDISLKMYDYGTTEPQRADTSTLPNVNVINGEAASTAIPDEAIGGNDEAMSIVITE
ncbi:MAG: hypothetical protein LIO59_07415 [Oscillospiraceae bacterium]|nr:hypothetical protein [Oscillospiraceae bacterium]